MATHKRWRLTPIALAVCAGVHLDGGNASAGSSDGEASALLKRANYFRSALSKEQDPALAFHWMEQAARKGSSAAQYELGKMYLHGSGAPYDPELARAWLQKASATDKRALAALAKLSEQPPKAPPTIPKRAAPPSHFEISASQATRNSVTGLVDAASRGDVRALSALLQAEANIDAVGPDGTTPLMGAAASGQLQTAKLLLERGADPNVSTLQAKTALEASIRNRHPEIANMLLRTGKLSRPSLDRALFAAVDLCDESMIKTLRDRGAAEAPIGGAMTPLMRAAGNCGAAVVDMLALPERINVTDQNGRTALWFAAQHGDTDVIARLIAKGAAKDISDHFGATPLMAALEQLHEDAAIALIRAGAEVSPHTAAGLTPLMLSSHRGLRSAVLELLNHGADPNLRDDQGLSALMVAAQRGHVDIVGALLVKGADRNLRNKKRERALDLAVDEKVQRLLTN